MSKLKLTVIKTALTTYSIDQMGRKQGKQHIFDTEGVIKEELHYKDDVLHGDHTTWFNGNITAMIPYKMGVKHGVVVDWSKRTTYKDGVKHGPFKDLDPTYPSHGAYKQGKLHGPYYEVHCGSTVKQHFYKDGLKHGECVDLKGSHIESSGVYKNGTLVYKDSEEYQVAVAMGKERAKLPLQETYGQYLAQDNNVYFAQRNKLLKRTVTAIQKQVTDAVSNVQTHNNNITIVINV